MFNLVKEGLGFQRGKDPHSAMGIGRRAQIEQWLNEMGIEDYNINEDFTIDVYGNVYLEYKNIESLPSFIQFGTVEGNFMIGNNNLNSLIGCPIRVFGSFACDRNNLRSLEGAPKEVREDFWSHNNFIIFTETDIARICDVAGTID